MLLCRREGEKRQKSDIEKTSWKESKMARKKEGRDTKVRQNVKEDNKKNAT